MKRFQDVVLGVLMLGVFVYVACATDPVRRRSVAPAHTAVIYQRVPCMEPPPAIAVPTWPTPDRLGNFIMHESTATLIKGQIYDQAHYIARQYRRCAEAAK